jgi:hypothetical protein
MHRDVEAAAASGADGIVFGVLHSADQRICEPVVRSLVHVAQQHGLTTTFHRAFDAAPRQAEALETLIDCGIDTILTAGMAWGHSGSAIDGLEVDLKARPISIREDRGRGRWGRTTFECENNRGSSPRNGRTDRSSHVFRRIDQGNNLNIQSA